MRRKNIAKDQLKAVPSVPPGIEIYAMALKMLSFTCTSADLVPTKSMSGARFALFCSKSWCLQRVGGK